MIVVGHFWVLNFITYTYDMGLMFNMIMSKVRVGTFTMGKSPNDLTPKCQGTPIRSTFQCVFVTYKGLNKVKLDSKSIWHQDTNCHSKQLWPPKSTISSSNDTWAEPSHVIMATCVGFKSGNLEVGKHQNTKGNWTSWKFWKTTSITINAKDSNRKMYKNVEAP